MRLDDVGFSENVRDQRGRSFGGGGFGGGGGGMFGMLFGLVLSRFGIGGVLLLALGYCAMTMMSGTGGGGTGAVAPHQQSAARSDSAAGGGSGSEAQRACAKDAASTFSCRVLRSTLQENLLAGSLAQARCASLPPLPPAAASERAALC